MVNFIEKTKDEGKISLINVNFIDFVYFDTSDLFLDISNCEEPLKLSFMNNIGGSFTSKEINNGRYKISLSDTNVDVYFNAKLGIKVERIL